MLRTETSGNTSSPTSATSGALRSSRRRSAKPRTTGMKTICRMLRNRSANPTWSCSPASATTHAGMTNGAASVVTVVMATESATSPLPR